MPDLFGEAAAPQTIKLAPLMNEWRERDPKALEFFGPGKFWLHLAQGVGCGVNAYRPGPMDLYLIEGHARCCIERAGYDVEMGRQRLWGEDRWFAHAHRCPPVTGIVNEPITATGPTLAVALVRLRLALPRAAAAP